ncbi:Superfamily I DNA or RNA helicase [Georgenia satyanarayanai]|uniref:DNA 3'-5' helicase n=1 Tax=Georgenia satyanarayanai TaxID=860221 RepID=A0A2Y9BWZ6_9MICO|nr:ATP-dependent DNA helicase [Georgenia satyanarayanai]PYG00553.1 superfamily I DNA/RNA helicase [Georgenia satyanarayanai]SSA39942.1 Superfamily I DNA or RNA helicase [Georgenia satyanarayanai]
MTQTAVRLSVPAACATVDLDADQLRVVMRPVGAGNLLVVGAPGSGKTTTAVETFLARAGSSAALGSHPLSSPALFLAPSRRAADRVRDAVGTRLLGEGGSTRGLVRSVASFAYAVVHARATALRQPPPTLVTGPQQDATLAELLAGHADGLGRDPRWPAGIGPETRAQPAFRNQLRDLLTRAVELGLSPEELADLGRRAGRPEWESAAVVLAEYTDVTVLGETPADRGARYDVAAVVDVATHALRTWREDLPDLAPPRWGTVVVDDYQDATLATARLLHALADDGAELVLLGDPDAGVQGFRGGTPALVGRAVTREAIGGFDAEREVLGTVWRGTPSLREVTRRVTSEISVVGGARHRSAPHAEVSEPEPRPGEAPHGVETAVLRSPSQQAAHVARRLREEHLHHGTPWSRMVVVVRSTGQVAGLRRQLREAGVPVAQEGARQALREEPAVRPLLTALRAVTGTLDAEAAVALLCSPLGGMDSVSLRGLRRSLRGAVAAELPEGSAPVAVRAATDDLLLEVLAEPVRAANLPGPHRSGPVRVSRVLAAGRAAHERGGGATEVLWALWDAAGLAEPWRRRALAGGAAGERADADLDALMALFRAAEQFDERHAGAGPAGFVAEVLAQDIAADTLAAQGQRRETVAILTPAGTGGGQWEVVVLAGLQEDVWPDLRLRDTLLGAGELADIASGRREPGTPVARSQARRDVLDDELRMLAVAVSRATRRLVATAVLDLDDRPSSFLELLGADSAGEAAGPVPPALDLRGLVAELRAALDSELLAEAHGQGQPDRREAAAALLAHLAAHEVPGADPEEWHGLAAASSTAPLHGPDQQVPVTPSTVETADRCPLRWALQTAGGRREDSLDQSLGNLVHDIAAEHPHGSLAELRTALEARWSSLGLGEGWVGQRSRAEAELMIERLAHYMAGVPGEVDVETAFTADVGRARLVGRIDRVERLGPADGDGEVVRVVDLKTSKNPVSEEEARTNAQLATYQVAVEAGGLAGAAESAGARLVYLGTGKAGATERRQVPPGEAEDPAWAHTLVARVADTMAGSRFEARVNPGCSHCPVRRSCPLQSEGRQVTQ